MSEHEPLKFIVSPHIVEDFGLNLYTDLARVLVEFVANAYDANSKNAKILFDKASIDAHREKLKKEWQGKVEESVASGIPHNLPSLAEHVLPPGVTIIVEDEGHGMSRHELQKKFLIAGRRRREEVEAGTDPTRSKGGHRILMGRKGLGKLAGFGVAKTITVISKAEDEPHATKIVLDYDRLVETKNTHEIPIEEDVMPDGGGFGKSGTKIILSNLFYEPMKTQPDTLARNIADHFMMIHPDDFSVFLNGNLIAPTQVAHAYAWPNPEIPPISLVEQTLTTEDGQSISFKYRLRFTIDRTALRAKERGIRVYAHNRLASAPSLLDADTNMHGFRMTDYLDGVVHADFIDDQPKDYIATDRQSLRWETPLLEPMYHFLSNEIKAACLNRQHKRDEEMEKEAERDTFTLDEITKAELTKKGKAVAIKIATALSSLHKGGLKDEGYKTQFTQVMRGMGQGEILTALSKLASEKKPDFDKLVSEITKLTAEELDGFHSFVKGRLSGIKALKTIVGQVDFRKKQNEKHIQTLFEKSPWLIDPMYSQFLVADQRIGEMYERLAKHLKISKHGKSDDKKRPDLVFLLASASLSRLVIVELKSSNLPLDNSHLQQLEYYMGAAKKWLDTNDKPGFSIHGHLIGSLPPPETTAEACVVLLDKIKDAGPSVPWKIRDYLDVLENTEKAHIELLAVIDKTEEPILAEKLSHASGDGSSK